MNNKFKNLYLTDKQFKELSAHDITLALQGIQRKWFRIQYHNDPYLFITRMPNAHNDINKHCILVITDDGYMDQMLNQHHVYTKTPLKDAIEWVSHEAYDYSFDAKIDTESTMPLELVTNVYRDDQIADVMENYHYLLQSVKEHFKIK